MADVAMCWLVRVVAHGRPAVARSTVVREAYLGAASMKPVPPRKPRAAAAV